MRSRGARALAGPAKHCALCGRGTTEPDRTACKGCGACVWHGVVDEVPPAAHVDQLPRGGGGGTGGEEREGQRAPPACEAPQADVIACLFSPDDVAALASAARGRHTLQDADAERLMAVRPHFVTSPYLRGDPDADALCAAFHRRLASMANSMAASDGTPGAERRLFLRLAWRLLLSPHPVQWETVVYLFHDDEAEVAARTARADDSAGHQDMAIDSHALAHFLALTAALAVECACAVVGPGARDGFLAFYAGELDVASLAKAVAESGEQRGRMTAAVLSRWAEQHGLTGGPQILGLRLLLRARCARSHVPATPSGAEAGNAGARGERAAEGGVGGGGVVTGVPVGAENELCAGGGREGGAGARHASIYASVWSCAYGGTCDV